MRHGSHVTYRNQSTEKMIAIMSVGKPTVSNTMSMVTRPACGMAAAPTDAKMDVKLKKRNTEVESEMNLQDFNHFSLKDRLYFIICFNSTSEYSRMHSSSALSES